MLQHKIVLPQQMVLTFVPTSWLREMTNTFQLLPVEPVSQSSIMHIHVNMQDGHLWNWCTYRKDLQPIRLLAFELDWNNKVKKELLFNKTKQYNVHLFKYRSRQLKTTETNK